MISRVNNNGLNVPSYQASTEYPNLRHEYITIPPTSTPSFGAYSVFDFREKSLLLHEIILQYKVPAMTKISPDTFARFSPAYFFFQRIEIVLNNQIIDTIYGTEQFVKNQLFITDEKRSALNYAVGDYLAGDFRNAFFTAGRTYYVPLSTFFNVSNMPMLYPKDDLQLRLYSNTISNVITSSSTTTTYATPQGFTCNLIAKVTRLPNQLNTYYISEINRSVQHYKFNELRYGTFNVTASSNGRTTLVLNQITGNVDWFFFIVRSSSSITKEGNFTFNIPVTDFSILDATSTNITGGQPIPSDQAIHVMAKNWTVSSYLQDSMGGNGPDNYVYMYSFGSDPIETVHSGATFNTHRFTGNEQLQINWGTLSSTSLQIDIYAYVQSVIECSPTYVKKMNL